MGKVVQYCESIYSPEGKLIDSIRKSKTVDVPKSSAILEPYFKEIDNLSEKYDPHYVWDIFELCFSLDNKTLDKDWKFLVNNFFPLEEKAPPIVILAFLCMTRKSSSRKDLLRWTLDFYWLLLRETKDLESLVYFLMAISVEYAKSSLESSDFDFLEGQIKGPKMYDWAVGQVLRKYPKKYNPTEVKDYIKERFKE